MSVADEGRDEGMTLITKFRTMGEAMGLKGDSLTQYVQTNVERHAKEKNVKQHAKEKNVKQHAKEKNVRLKEKNVQRHANEKNG